MWSSAEVFFATAEGESKQATACQFKKTQSEYKIVVFSSQYQLLADLGCPNCPVDAVAPDNTGE